MKKLILAVACFLTVSVLFAQEKVERFCEVSIYFGKSKQFQITIDLGDTQSSTFKDENIIKNLNKVKSFNSVVDIMNFMSKSGWTLVSVNNLSWNTLFYYKKDFDKSELIDTSASKE